MNTAASDVSARTLSLPEELILMLLNEENGYFHQVPGWNLNCAVAGAVLAELSLRNRVDTDADSLFLVDLTRTGDPILDPFLDEIISEPAERKAQYWIERLAPQSESVIDMTLQRMVSLKILDAHDGDFWTLSNKVRNSDMFQAHPEEGEGEFVKSRVRRAIFEDRIPDPRDIILICLINTCDVFRFIYQLDEDAEERIRFFCNIDLLGRSMAVAVSESLTVPFLRHSALAKAIPNVSLTKLLFNSHLRDGNVPALFADLTEQYGPVFRINPPFSPPMTFLAGPETNQWANRNGRLYLRAQDYFSDFEKVYGAHGVLPSLDGGDHFRLRKSLQASYSRGRLITHLERVYGQARAFMSDWQVGQSYQATNLCRVMINAQLSPIFIGVDSQDLIGDLIKYKERALTTHVMRALPKFMLKTPGMRRREKKIDTLLERVQGVHTPAQRAGQPRDLADDLLSLHGSDPQLVPESNLRFALSAALVASVYLGDAFSFALYAMASQPELYENIQEEADALFENGDPGNDDFTLDAIDVTHRFLMECLRVYPIVPMSIRNVMNSCVVEGYELPVGERLFIAQTATHYMEECFPDPFKFDIDRYQEPRNEHRGPGYAPYGLGTHRCLGSRWMDLQLAVNVLMVAHYFNIRVSPRDYKLKFSPIPSQKPSKRLMFRVVERRREIHS